MAKKGIGLFLERLEAESRVEALLRRAWAESTYFGLVVVIEEMASEEKAVEAIITMIEAIPKPDENVIDALLMNPLFWMPDVQSALQKEDWV